LKSDLQRIAKRHFVPSSRAILNECISEVNGELLVLDFCHFRPPNTTDKKNEMDFHLKVAKYGKHELLVHPIMQAFLDIKWGMFKKMFWLNLILDLTFAIFLTLVGHHFARLTHCHPCNEDENDWSMKTYFCIDTNKNGTKFNKGFKCEKGFLR
jgi:hypothetical protein